MNTDLMKECLLANFFLVSQADTTIKKYLDAI